MSENSADNRSNPTPAVLFDIDGTLVDSNYLHIQAWSEALQHLGHPVDDWRIHRCIGMDSKKLLAELLGDGVERLGEAAKAEHATRYAELAGRLRTFAGARDLLAAVAGRGLQVVLATSAPEEELRNLLKVLDVDQWTAHITSAEDVETAKPEPRLLEVALDKAAVPPDLAVMIGDAVWDGQAATRAGIPFIGLRSGGISRAELVDAGAVAVYDDAADLLAGLDDDVVAGFFRMR